MEMLLFDFKNAPKVDDWVPMSDVVMGGASAGRLEATGNDTVAFTGLVSLANDGGFSSIRSRSREHDLRGYAGLELQIRGNGRRYKINLKTELRPNAILYSAAFDTLAGERQTLRLPFSEFRPTFRGRLVREARPLDLSCVTSLGLMISDRQAGPFRLEIARIGAYAD